jgi:hypothetical protein
MVETRLEVISVLRKRKCMCSKELLARCDQFCSKCAVCQSVQHGASPRKGMLQTHEANGPMDRLHNAHNAAQHETTRYSPFYLPY